jgi:hypothetical protein
MKKLAWIIALIGLVLAPSLWFWGRPACRRHKESRTSAAAQRYMAQRDYRNASLSARQALAVNPGNPEACRVMAELAEMTRSPLALDWRRRLAEAAPTLQNKLDLASVAIRLQAPPCPLASQMLEQLAEAGKGSAAYHAARAELALKINQPDLAAASFAEASRLEPTNQFHRLNVAVLRLRSADPAVAIQARATLESLAGNTDLSLIALRWLTGEALRKNDLARAETSSRRGLADTRAGLDDRLQHAAILRRAQNPAWESFLAGLQRGARTNAASLYAVCAWMAGESLLLKQDLARAHQVAQALRPQ